MQDASRYTPIKHPGQAASAMAPHGYEIPTFFLGDLQDCLHDRAEGNEPADLDAFLAELSFQGSQIGFCFLRSSVGFLLICGYWSPLGCENMIGRLNGSQKDHSRSSL